MIRFFIDIVKTYLALLGTAALVVVLAVAAFTVFVAVAL